MLLSSYLIVSYLSAPLHLSFIYGETLDLPPDDEERLHILRGQYRCPPHQ